MSNGNGTIQTDQSTIEPVKTSVKNDFEKRRLPTNIFPDAKKINKSEEKRNEKTTMPGEVEEIVKYLSEFSTKGFGVEEAKILGEFVMKCFSANRADLIKNICGPDSTTSVRYNDGNGGSTITSGTYNAYIASTINNLLKEVIEKGEKSQEIRNIFNAINDYDINIFKRLGDNQAKVLYKIHCETEEGREKLKKFDTYIAKIILNEYYLERVMKLEISDLEIKDQKE